MLNLLFTAQESTAGVTAHSSESVLEYDCSDFIYHVMEYFPKSLFFWKGESLALAILLKADFGW